MSKSLHPHALFRLTVLGPLASRNQLRRGEVKALIRELATQTYHIPGTRRVHLSEQTILRWYYDWKRNGIEGLIPSSRSDKGQTQLSIEIQNALLHYKKDNPARSINTLISLIEKQGLIAKNKLSTRNCASFFTTTKTFKARNH